MAEETHNEFGGTAYGPVVQAGSVSGGIHFHQHGPGTDGAPRRIDFSGYAEQKRRDFTGRRWLFDAVQSWRSTTDERALLITGAPGTGKSAFLAELVHRSASDGLLAHYFCAAEDRTTLEPAAFVGHLVAELSHGLPEFARLAAAPGTGALLRREEIERDPGHALDQGVIAVLRQLPAPSRGSLRHAVIVVDGLDESRAGRDRRDTVSALLASRIERFPPWVRFVLAARPTPSILTTLGGARVLPIAAEQPQNLLDVSDLIDRHLAAPAWRERLDAAGVSRSDALERIAAAAEGNFLYATMALQAIDLGRCSLADLGALPPGLAGIYELFLARHFPTGAGYAAIRPLLEAVAAAREPLPGGVVAAVCGLERAYELPAALTALATLMPERNGRYSFFHHSLEEWLTDPGHPYRVDLPSGHRRLSAGFLDHLAAPVPRLALTTPAEPVARYWARHGLDHLALGGDRVPADVSPGAFAPVAVSAQDHVWALGDWTANGLPPRMRRYVESLLHPDGFEDLRTLLTVLKRVVMAFYAQTGLVRERVEDDGHLVYEILHGADDGHTVLTALKVTGFAGAVFRAARECPDTALDADRLTALVDQLRTVRYLAGGFEYAGWAADLPGGLGSLAHAGGALNRELHRLTDGL
ncbi:AAA family ATPase [Kitasatospora sp. NPDC003701]